MTKRPISVSELTQAALSKRSALYVWMLENHDTFAGVVAKAGRPNWKALAEMFGAQGYTDSAGQAPSDEVTRQTWWKVRKALKARRAKRASGPTKETQPTPSAASPPAQQSSLDILGMLSPGRKLPDPL
jgi:hypothetical protein